MNQRVIDHVAETLRFEAGKGNALMNTDAIVSGYVILLDEHGSDDERELFYSGRGKHPTSEISDAYMADTPEQAWNTIINEKVMPIGKELPRVVYCGTLYFVSQKEIV